MHGDWRGMLRFLEAGVSWTAETCRLAIDRCWLEPCEVDQMKFGVSQGLTSVRARVVSLL